MTPKAFPGERSGGEVRVAGSEPRRSLPGSGWEGKSAWRGAGQRSEASEWAGRAWGETKVGHSPTRPGYLIDRHDWGKVEAGHSLTPYNRSRPCGASRSSTGPSGTIRVGLMSVWVT